MESATVTNVMVNAREDPRDDLVSTSEVARLLGIHRVTAAQVVRSGRLPALKVANRWLVRRSVLEEFAKTYEGRPGRPRREPKGRLN